jgi:hypothetical protein
MADSYRTRGSDGRMFKEHDNGDGTFSDTVALTAGATVDIGDVQLLAGTALIGKVDSVYLVPNGTQADQALTVDATAGGVQFAAFHADTTHVVLDVQTADVMCTFDNSAPTSSNGHRLYVGDQYVWPKARAAAAKFIRISAVSGLIAASQMKGA